MPGAVASLSLEGTAVATMFLSMNVGKLSEISELIPQRV